MDTINEEGLNELHQRADRHRKNAEISLRSDNPQNALVYATLYLAENIRIGNFLTEERMDKEFNV